MNYAFETLYYSNTADDRDIIIIINVDLTPCGVK